MSEQRVKKFRAWNGEAMVQVGSIEFTTSISAPYIVFDEHRNLIVDVDSGKFPPEWLMSETGYGNHFDMEIYEDDVVYLAGYGNYRAVFPFIELHEAQAEGDIGAILGNIHANPELLEKAA